QFWSARAGIVEGVNQDNTITGGVAALDDERRYQAAVSKDPRFDGVFFIAVTSTGIYCRPSCPAITPKRANMRFYRSAAAAQEARLLTETTALPLSEIAFAAGFASIRQFNATVHEVFAMTPTQLREARGQRAARTRRLLPSPGDHAAPGLIRLRLAYRAPIDGERMLGFLAARAIPGVEEVRDGCYRRTINLPNGVGILSLGPLDRKSTRLNSSHRTISYAVFC